MSLAETENKDPLWVVAMFCALRGRQWPDEEIAKNLYFNSAEEMRSQLKNWDIPDWVIGEDPSTTPRSTTRTQSNSGRRARAAGATKELPPASNAAPLFKEKLDSLAQANEDLRHRKERLQGGQFIQSALYTDPVYHKRDRFSAEEWKSVCDLYNLEPEAEGFLDMKAKTWNLGAGTPAPQAPLPALIAAYILMEGQIELLLDALYPGTPSEETSEKIRKRIEGKKSTDKQDGLKAIARQLATLVRGGELGKGRDPADISPREVNVASRITELREQGWSDKDIYQKLHSSPGFAHVLSSWEEYQRLAGLQLRFPFA